MKIKLLSIGLGVIMCMGMQSAMAQVNVNSVYPEPTDQSYDYNTYYEVTVSATAGITSFEEATFSYNDKSIELEKNTYAGLNGAPDSQIIQLKISYPGMTNYVKQAVDAGADSFTLTIKGVMCGDTPVTGSTLNNDRVKVSDGTISLTYPLETAAAYLPDESVWPEKIYSYWAPGAEGSTATLVFSQDVVKVYEATLTMAQVQDGGGAGANDLKSYTLPTKFDGNKMIIDFSGQHFEGRSNTVTVILRGIDGANGLPADLGNGSVSLFQYLTFVNEPAPNNGGSDGVESILQDNIKSQNVYNLKGEKVNSENLDKGVYIINGKKVMVK